MRGATMLLALVVVLVAVPACTGLQAGKDAKAGEKTKAGKEPIDRGDYATALKEWRPLAEQGEARAQTNLGVMYRLGEGVPQDNTEAVRWYRRAAEQGHTKAQFKLCAMYFMGRGVPQDDVQAHMWLNLAAAPGHELARKIRDNLAEKMTPAQLADAQRLAREWKAKGK